jgi:putative endonuclease
MEICVYAIRSKIDGRIYVGQTNNVDKRLKQHNAGKTVSTRPYKPWEIIHKENFPNRIEARKREKFLKRWFWKRIFKR